MLPIVQIPLPFALGKDVLPVLQEPYWGLCFHNCLLPSEVKNLYSKIFAKCIARFDFLEHLYCTCLYCKRRSVSVEDFAVIRHFIPELPTNKVSGTVPVTHRLLKHITVSGRVSIVYCSVGLLRPTI